VREIHLGGRYLVTGVQLGMIRGLLLLGDTKPLLKLLDTIEADQFTGNSVRDVLKDTTSLIFYYGYYQTNIRIF